MHSDFIQISSIAKPPRADQPVKHNALYHMETLGAPVFTKSRQVAPDRLQTAKTEIQHMLDLDRIHPSKSNYASTLQMIQKKIQFRLPSYWIPCFGKGSRKIPEPFRDRVEVNQNFARPQTITQLRKFLGLYNFNRPFIFKASHILAPLARFLEGFTNKKMKTSLHTPRTSASVE
ncbi:endonuclease [Caerostris extrusa]|uniref:Endonuclease n=1 Tax=Caerostris extrusa TaxID=172846 RepID=A0AAV4RPG2_CAEEX|nr:endonuclease [Caerostris extrusa]